MSNGKQVTGDGVILLVIGLLIWAGFPASAYALAFFCLWLLVNDVKHKLEGDAEPGSLVVRSTIAAIESAAKAAYWSAIGCSLVWLIQMVLLIMPSVDPDAMGQSEIRFADAIFTLREVGSTFHFILFMLAAFAMAMAVGALWPIGGAHYLKKVMGALIATGMAMISFTFVGTNVAGQRYDPALASMRAEINDMLSKIIEQRREAASYHWLSLLIEDDLTPTPASAANWRAYLKNPMATCDRDENIYQGFYERQQRSSKQFSYYCNHDKLKEALVDDRLELNATNGPNIAILWLSDLTPYVTLADTGVPFSDPDATVRSSINKFSNLKAVRILIQRKLDSTKKARDTLRDIATSGASVALKGLLPEEIGDIVGEWSETLVRDISEKASSQIGGRLRQTKLINNSVVAELIGVDESGAKLAAPQPGDGVKFYEKWLRRQGHKPDPDEKTLETYARDGVLKDDEIARERKEEQAREAAAMKQMIDRSKQYEHEHEMEGA